MDEDRIKGKTKGAVGSAKESIGKAVGDKDIERSGKADQAEGTIQKTFGKANDTVRGKE